MADLSTRYLGLKLANPLLVGACSLSNKVETIQKLEAEGAGGLVIKSLFEEQVLHEAGKLEEMMGVGGEAFAESLTYFPKLQHAGAREHVMWVEKARAAVKMPLIGSVNAIRPGAWAEYSRRLADAGVNAIELNAYAVEADPATAGADVEKRLFDAFTAVKAATKLPVSVKLSPFYTATANVVKGLVDRGAAGVVLFNRFLQPDINPETEKVECRMSSASREESRLAVRWIALLAGRTKADLCGSTGIATGEDVARYVLAGANAVQVVSALYKDGLGALGRIRGGLSAWMDKKGYKTLADFRGKASQQTYKGNPALFERAQYFDFLMRSNNA